MVNESNPKISNILLIRRNVLEYLKEIEHSKDIDMDALERIGDYFLRYDELIIPMLIEEFVKIKEERVLTKYEYLLKYLDNPNLIKPLIQSLVKNKENLKLKTSILRVLKHYNVDFSSPPLNLFYSEFLTEAQKIADKLINSYNSNWYNFSSAFFEFSYLEEGQINVLKCIEKSNDKRKYGVFLTMLLTNNPILINSVIEILGKSYDVEAFNILEKAFVFLPTKYHNLIDTNLRKLRFKGINKDEDIIEENNILHCYVSYPLSEDEVYILYDIQKNDFRIIILMELNLEEGICENCNFNISKNLEMHNMNINTLIKNMNLREITNGYDVRLLNNAIFSNYVNDSKFPPGFSILINFLPAYYFKPILYHPERVREKYKFYKDKEYLLKNSFKIWDIVDKLGWLSENYHFVAIVEKWYLNSKKDEYFWMDDLFIRKVLREIILSDINNWKNKLLFLADFLDNINENREYIDIIIAVYDELTKDIEKTEKIPFIRKLILGSKDLVLIFLK